MGLPDVQLGEESGRLLASGACHSGVDDGHGLTRLPLVGSLVGHRAQDVGTEEPVISGMGSAQACDVVALRQPVLSSVVANPTNKLSEFGKRHMELAAGGVTVGALIEQASDPAKMILCQRQYVAATSHVIHGPEFSDHGREPVDHSG